MISQQIDGPLNQFLDSLFSDTGLTKTIIVRSRGTLSWDPDTRQNVAIDVDHSVTAIQSRHNRRSVGSSHGTGVQVGDRLYVIRYDDAPENLSVNDVIVDDDQTLDVKAIDRIFTYVYSITVEGAA
jgi:hypothetical protein